MKNFKCLILCIFLGVGLAQAQQRPSGGMRESNPTERAKNNVQRLHKELNLTQTQQDSIYTYFLQRLDMRQEQVAKSKDNKENKRKGMQNMREQQKEKIKSFLTKEQIEKFERMEKERNTKRPV